MKKEKSDVVKVRFHRIVFIQYFAIVKPMRIKLKVKKNMKKKTKIKSDSITTTKKLFGREQHPYKKNCESGDLFGAVYRIVITCCMNIYNMYISNIFTTSFRQHNTVVLR